MQEGDIIELEGDASRTFEVAKHALVGKIISEKALNRKTVRGMIIKSWGNPRGMYIVNLSTNTYLFNFSEPATPRRIMAEAPWNILGSLLCLHRWTPEFTVHEIDFTYSPFWIQIHGVPLDGISKENARRIASKVGEVEEVEDPFMGYKLARGFMRARVNVDITKSLITGFRIPRKEMPNTWAWIYYEKLQDYCFKCGRLGHGRKDCDEPEAVALWNPSKPRYGPKLGVPPLKELTSVIAGMSHNGDEESEVYAQGWESENDGRGGREFSLGFVKAGDVMARVARVADRRFPQKVEEQVKQKEAARLTQWAVKEKGEKGEGSGKESTMESEIVQPSLQKEDVISGAEDSGPNIGPNSGGPVQLTRVDLKEKKIRPRLGPSTLEELQIEAEDIGLKEKVVVTDMLSPERYKNINREEGPSQLDMFFNTDQITKMKQAIAARNSGPREAGQDDPKLGMELVVWEPREKIRSTQGMEYYVELPDEDDPGEDMQLMSVKECKEENILAEIVLRTLTLKRMRDEGKEDSGRLEQQEESEGMQGSKGKKARGDSMYANEDTHQEKMDMETDCVEKAEEAGPTMPHLAP